MEIVEHDGFTRISPIHGFSFYVRAEDVSLHVEVGNNKQPFRFASISLCNLTEDELRFIAEAATMAADRLAPKPVLEEA